MAATKKDPSKAGVVLTPKGKPPTNAAQYRRPFRQGGSKVAITPMIIGPSGHGFAKAPIDTDRTVVADGGDLESILTAMRKVIKREGGADQVTAVHVIVRSVVEPDEEGDGDAD